MILEVPNYEYIVDHIVTQGLPLILTNTTEGWEREKFSWHWLQENMGTASLENSPRDNDALEDLNGWTVEQYLTHLLPSYVIIAKHMLSAY